MSVAASSTFRNPAPALRPMSGRRSARWLRSARCKHASYVTSRTDLQSSLRGYSIRTLSRKASAAVDRRGTPAAFNHAADEVFCNLAALPRLRLIEVVALSLADISDAIGDVPPAVRRLVLGQVRKHLDGKAAVETIGYFPPPWAPDNLRRHAPRRARLGHDVIGNLVRALDQLGARQDLVDHAVFQRQLGVYRLTGE